VANFFWSGPAKACSFMPPVSDKNSLFIDFIVDQFALRIKKEGQERTLSPLLLSPCTTGGERTLSLAHRDYSEL
jgi:hypothetical protein